MGRFESEFGKSRFYRFGILGMTVFFALLAAENLGADLPLGLTIASFVAFAVMLGVMLGELVAFVAKRGPYRDEGTTE